MKNIALLILFTLSLNAQDSQPKPMKHEKGDVTIAAADAADYYARKNINELKKIQTSCINLVSEESFKKLITDYIRGKSLLQAGRYTESRRMLEDNSAEIKTKTDEIIKYYREAAQKMGEEAGRLSVELSLQNNSGNDYLIPVINKNLKNSNEAIKMAEDMILSSNQIEGLYYYKSAITSLVKAIYYYNKSDVRGLSGKQKAEKNILIDDDLLPKNYLKEYDDSRNLLHSEEEKKREKQREYSRRVLGLNKKPQAATANEPKTEENKQQPAETK